MTISSSFAARKQFLLLGLLFIGPMLIATWMYFADTRWQPLATTNHGRLLKPIINLDDPRDPHPLSALTAGQTDNYWVLIYDDAAECLETCFDALIRQSQTRMMLGKDVRRVKRVFLHGATTPDTVFLNEHHQGLITINDSGLRKLLDTKRPDDLPAGGLYLVDPLDNLVMYFSADLAIRDVVDDIKHLLNVSRIG
jgi:hypothetical protein